jgi:hypothetical protein
MSWSVVLRAHILPAPPTVNEVGHSKESQQNVFTREFDDRVVKYFFVPSEKMKIGKPVELLTNYKDHYEGKVLMHFFIFCLLTHSLFYVAQAFASVMGMVIATSRKVSLRTMNRFLIA